VAATAPSATPGQFPQVASVRFSFDPGLPAGDRSILNAGVFADDGTLIKSKGSASPFGNNAGTGDGTGNNNEARLQAAQALDAWLDTDPSGAGDPDVLIIGDLNA
jgi:hypothetical protein